METTEKETEEEEEMEDRTEQVTEKDTSKYIQKGGGQMEEVKRSRRRRWQIGQR